MICFHKPNEENGYLSNWYLLSFEIDGIKFSSVEQYMMYKKAICFNDLEIANKIMATDNVESIKAFGRAVSNYNDDVWSAIRKNVVKDALLAKFSQNSELKDKLLNTGNDTLCECAVRDLIWGIGLSMSDPDRFNKEKWRGNNLLGNTLMEVREELRK